MFCLRNYHLGCFIVCFVLQGCLLALYITFIYVTLSGSLSCSVFIRYVIILMLFATFLHSLKVRFGTQILGTALRLQYDVIKSKVTFGKFGDD